MVAPYEVLSLRARVDLGAMAMKRYSAFPKSHHYRNVTIRCLMSYQETLWGGVLPYCREVYIYICLCVCVCTKVVQKVLNWIFLSWQNISISHKTRKIWISFPCFIRKACVSPEKFPAVPFRFFLIHSGLLNTKPDKVFKSRL